MYTDQTLNHIRTMLLSSGFEPMDGLTLYRATAETPSAPMPRHNVFVSIDTDGIEVMAPIGPADDYSPADLVVVRRSNDGYDLLGVASQIALKKELSKAVVLADGDHVIQEAVRLAKYASFVEPTLEVNRARKLQLLTQAETATLDPTFFHTTGTAPEVLLADMEELLTLLPEPGLYLDIKAACANSLMTSWASSSGTLSQNPWNTVIEGLEGLARRRGWPVDHPS